MQPTRTWDVKNESDVIQPATHCEDTLVLLNPQCGKPPHIRSLIPRGLEGHGGFHSIFAEYFASDDVFDQETHRQKRHAQKVGDKVGEHFLAGLDHERSDDELALVEDAFAFIARQQSGGQELA
jgi:hypothetical protein